VSVEQEAAPEYASALYQLECKHYILDGLAALRPVRQLCPIVTGSRPKLIILPGGAASPTQDLGMHKEEE
jgi:hypothetical protein